MEIPDNIKKSLRNKIDNESDLNKYLHSIIREWSFENYTCLYKIKETILNNIVSTHCKEQVNKSIHNCECYRKHQDMISHATTKIYALSALRPVLTLKDVIEILKESGTNYKLLGPIVKFPAIKELILESQDVDYNFMPYNLRWTDLMIDLNDFLDKQLDPDDYRNSIDPNRFYDYLKIKYQVDDIRDLGIKFNNYQLFCYNTRQIKIASMNDLLISDDKLVGYFSNFINKYIGKIKHNLHVYLPDIEDTKEIQKFMQKSAYNLIDDLLNILENADTHFRKKYNLPASTNKTIRKLVKLLKNHKIICELVQMVIANCLVGVRMDKEPVVTLPDYNKPNEWREKLFGPLLISTNHLFCNLWSHPTNDNLVDAYFRQVADIAQICILIDSTQFPNISPEIEKNLKDLKSLCRRLVAFDNWQNNRRQLQHFYLIRLQQILMTICSNEVIEHPTVNLYNKSSDSKLLLQSVFIGLCFINRLTMPDVVDNLLTSKTRSQHLLGLRSWPNNFREFSDELVTKGLKQILQNEPISNEETNPSSPTNKKPHGECSCINIADSWLIRTIRTCYNKLNYEEFINRVLPLTNGTTQLTTTNQKQRVESLWNSERNVGLMSDNLPCVLDMKSVTFASSSSFLCTNDENIFEMLSNVPYLENIYSYTMWNELYAPKHGDLTDFLLNRIRLATKYQLRLVKLTCGTIIRIPAQFNINIELQTSHCRSDGNYARLFVANWILLYLQSNYNDINHGMLLNLIGTKLTSSNPLLTTHLMSCIIDLCPGQFIECFCTQIFSKLLVIITDDPRQFIESMEMGNYIKKMFLLHMFTDKIVQKKIEITETPENRMVEEIDTPIVLNTDQNIIKSIKETEYSEDLDPFSVVERIREGFGMNKASKVSENCQKILSRVVDHLSSDLYAGYSHFLLELIQNADDNNYAINTLPNLTLEWNNNYRELWIFNNEIGMSSTDIESVCDIGSSKKRDKIGRKGIGFKSVFLVSDKPEIHSGGYHIYFDKTNDSYSGLVPHWIDHCPCNVYQGTLIKLPIKLKDCRQLFDKIQQQLLQSRLLLFLRQLKLIVMKDCSGIVKVELRLTDQPYSRLLSERCINERKWYVRQYQQVELAFPCDAEEEMCFVYAFLPLRSVGLKFDVNADFDVPASREDISQSSSNNKRCINIIAEILFDIFSNYRKYPSDFIMKVINSIPIYGHIPLDSPFAQLVFLIRDKLSGLPCIPVDTSTDDFILEKPDKVLLIPPLINRDNALNRLFKDNLMLYLPHRTLLDSEASVAIIRSLGVLDFNLEHMLLLIQQIDSFNEKIIVDIAIGLNICLEKTPINNRLRELLANKTICPIFTDKIHPPAFVGLSNHLFLPTPEQLIDPESTLQSKYNPIRQIICPYFLRRVDPQHYLNPIYILLRKLSVKELSCPTVILKETLSNGFDNYSSAVLSLSFIVENIYKITSNYSQVIKEALHFIKIPVVEYPSQLRSLMHINQTDKSSIYFSYNLLPMTCNPCSLLFEYSCVDGEALLKVFDNPDKWTDFLTELCEIQTCLSYQQIQSIIQLKDFKLNCKLLVLLDENIQIDLPNILLESAWIPDTKDRLNFGENCIYLSEESVSLNIPSYLSDYFPICKHQFTNYQVADSLNLTKFIDQPKLYRFLELVYSRTNEFVPPNSLYTWMVEQFSYNTLQQVHHNLKQHFNTDFLPVIFHEKLVCSSLLFWHFPPGNFPIFTKYLSAKSMLKDFFDFDKCKTLLVDIIGINEYPSYKQVSVVIQEIFQEYFPREVIKEFRNFLPRQYVDILREVYQFVSLLNLTNTELTSLKIIPCISGEIRSISDSEKMLLAIRANNQFTESFVTLPDVDFVLWSYYSSIHDDFKLLDYHATLKVFEDNLLVEVINRNLFQIDSTLNELFKQLENIFESWLKLCDLRNFNIEFKPLNFLYRIKYFFSCNDYSECVKVKVNIDYKNTKASNEFKENVIVLNDTLYVTGNIKHISTLKNILKGLIDYILPGQILVKLRRKFIDFIDAILYKIEENKSLEEVMKSLSMNNLKIKPFVIEYLLKNYGLNKDIVNKSIDVIEDTCSSDSSQNSERKRSLAEDYSTNGDDAIAMKKLKINSGQLGEKLACLYLENNKTMAIRNHEILEVDWINRNKESEEPYDIVLKLKDIVGYESRVYIEVKSTTVWSKTQFPISVKEVTTACYGYYHLMLVFHNGCDVGESYVELLDQMNRGNVRFVLIEHLSKSICADDKLNLLVDASKYIMDINDKTN